MTLRRAAWLLCLLTIAQNRRSPLLAQQAKSADTQTAQEAGAPNTPVLHVESKLVVVDVVVEDKNGQPVLGLKRDDFTIEENGTPQTARVFEPHTASDARPMGPPAPKLPPGSFTNYTPLPPAGTFNILLIDSLNTSLKDQSYLRKQLDLYLQHAPPGQSLAIFVLNRQLLMLQGFTSDPKLLELALARKGIIRASDFLEDPAGTNVDTETASDVYSALGPGFAEIASNVQQFEADTQAFNLDLRVRYTLDAMNALAHYLSNFPGRKNVIWFSGSFPINLLPDPSLTDALKATSLNADEFRETTRLLGDSQVAVYPVNAPGAVTPPAFDAARSGRKYATNPTAIASDASAFISSEQTSHATMQSMAADTGGRAFVSTNDLSGAVAEVISSSVNYYTLAYRPTNANAHGEYRRITVHLADATNASRYNLSYWRGYYADEPAKNTSALNPTATCRRIAMSHGAPEPQDILFRVSAHPLPDDPQSALAEGDELVKGAAIKGPFRRVEVRFTALPNGITFTQQADGRSDAAVSFDVYLYSEDGSLLLTNGRELKLHLTPAQHQGVMNSVLSTSLIVSVPVSQAVFLRMGVEDMSSGRSGVVEVFTRDLSKPSRGATKPQKAP